jgi:hypothetical protein
VHIVETCLGNRPQEASDELLDTQVETSADRGAEPDVQQAAQAEDEAAAACAFVCMGGGVNEWEGSSDESFRAGARAGLTRARSLNTWFIRNETVTHLLPPRAPNPRRRRL